jgi:DNA-binding PadR family transcriptional regulator
MMRRTAVISKVELVALGLLEEGPVHGYDLLERFRERSMGFWLEVGRASVYQALQRLERKGYVRGRAQPGDDGPDRRVYSITRTGRTRLREGIDERVGEPTPYETAAGDALGFVWSLPPREVKGALVARERSVRDLLDALDAELERTAGASGPSATVSRLLLQRQRALAEAEVAWIRAARAPLGRLRR